MKTVELVIRLPDAYHEFLIAELADLDFEAFVEDDGQLTAYVPAARWGDVAREHVEGWLRAAGLPVEIEERLAPEENWNAKWEATIQPLAVGPFLVKPTWADVPAEHAGRTVLEIDPKMSFGTGYHESTRLVLRFLPSLVRGGERVLDAGTGTGVLAIGALKLGAAVALGFDTDPWASTNATENAYLNDVAETFVVREGGIDVVPETGFDLVLANIHREVLIEMLPELAAKRAPGGYVVLAGLLRIDREAMLAAAHAAGLALHDEATENEWWACVLK